MRCCCNAGRPLASVGALFWSFRLSVNCLSWSGETFGGGDMVPSSLPGVRGAGPGAISSTAEEKRTPGGGTFLESFGCVSGGYQSASGLSSGIFPSTATACDAAAAAWMAGHCDSSRRKGREAQDEVGRTGAGSLIVRQQLLGGGRRGHGRY